VRTIASVALLVAASGLLSCSSDPGAAAHPQPATHTVTMEAVAFKPDVLTVKVGDSVIWVNKDPFPHTATSQPGGFDSKEIGVEKTWKHTLTQPGAFPYVCSLHPTMKGTLRVE
jgi:plastocyanin